MALGQYLWGHMVILRLKNEPVMGLAPQNRVLSKLYGFTDSHFFYFKGQRPNYANQRSEGEAILDSLRSEIRRECNFTIYDGCADFLLIGESNDR